MILRNLVILAIFSRAAVPTAAIPLGAMAAVSGVLVWLGHDRDGAAGTIRLASPVSLRCIVKFAALFLVLQVIGTLAQRYFGSVGLLAVSLIGGIVSSASTTATAASLAGSGKTAERTAAEWKSKRHP